MTARRLPNDCFALPPGVEWTPVDDALARLEAAMSPVTETRLLPLSAAEGLFLAEPAIALRDHPAADNAAVDGYAFAHPGEAPEMLRLSLAAGRAAAGAPWDGSLKPGEALRILTGAQMPADADTVVLQEDVEYDGGCISFPPPRKLGANRRKRGENIAVGDAVLHPGARLTPAAAAQAASAGVSAVEVHAPLKLAVLSTGDELIAPDEADEAPPDRVIDANGPMLASLGRKLGAEVVSQERAPDHADAVARALDRAAAQADAIVTSGGASGGDEDHIAKLLAARADADFHLWRIAVKPGRPLALGMWNGKPVFGLPGNPVAAFVCFLMFARPALLRLAGAAWPTPQRVQLPSGFDYRKKPGRREFLRVRIGADGRLEKYRSEGSGLIEGLLWSDGLADIAHDAGPFQAGERVDYISFAALDAV